MAEIPQDTGSAAHLAVLYRLPEDDELGGLEGRSWVVLSFVDSEIEARFLARCRVQDVTIRSVIRAAQHMDAASLAARDKYSSFIARWPDQYRKRGKNFKERFTHKGEISLWWLSSASAKDNEVYNTFDYLCHLEVVQIVMRQGQFERCLLLAGDTTLGELLRECCKRDRVAFEALSPIRSGGHPPSAISALWQRLFFVGWLILQIVFFRVFLRAARAPRTSPVTAFLSLYPGPLEIRNGQLVDRVYRDVVDVAEHGEPSPVILCWFKGKGLRRLYSDRRVLRSHQRILLLNTYLALEDIWLAVSNLGFFLRYLLMDRFDEDFRRSFEYDGLNIHQLIRPEFRRQFLSDELPYHMMVARAVERAVRTQGVERLVSFLELYPLSRAAYYGAKRGNPLVTTVAYQHANITKMRLWYTYRPEEVLSRGRDGAYVDTMPIPDRYLFQGPIGMEIIKASGYPAERCRLTGSPRYDDLGRRVQAGLTSGSIRADMFRASDGRDRKRVLITPSLSATDAQELIEVTLRSCRHRNDCSVIVKLHPDCHVDDEVKLLGEKYGFPNMIDGGDTHDLIEEADLVVTNYSTIGDEAIALGCPVVCYTGLRPCIATYLDLPAAPVVHDAEEMGQAIERMLYDEDYRRSYWLRRDDLIEGSFYRLDGRAKYRMVEALMDTTSRDPG